MRGLVTALTASTCRAAHGHLTNSFGHYVVQKSGLGLDIGLGLLNTAGAVNSLNSPEQARGSGRCSGYNITTILYCGSSTTQTIENETFVSVGKTKLDETIIGMSHELFPMSLCGTATAVQYHFVLNPELRPLPRACSGLLREFTATAV